MTNGLAVTRAGGKPPLATLPYVLAFAAIYILWGSTFFAIRVLVASVPPLLAAGLRFSIAGAAVLLWSALRRAELPTAREWSHVVVTSFLMFVIGYSCLFWAEMTLPSGIASVLVATIPLWTMVFEMVASRRPPTWGLSVAVAAGLGGVAVLSGFGGGGQPALLPVLAIMLSSLAWAAGSVLSKGMRLPASKLVSAGAQMLAGGLILLLLAAASGEMTPWPHWSTQAVTALLYLVVAGSIVAFTAYNWLLHHLPTTQVSSYAYVNPVIALALGHWFGKEALGWRAVCGAALIVVSVAAILLRRPTSAPRKPT